MHVIFSEVKLKELNNSSFGLNVFSLFYLIAIIVTIIIIVLVFVVFFLVITNIVYVI